MNSLAIYFSLNQRVALSMFVQFVYLLHNQHLKEEMKDYLTGICCF